MIDTRMMIPKWLGSMQEAEMLKPRVPALEAEVARLQVEVQDRNKGLRDAHTEESLARAEVLLLI